MSSSTDDGNGRRRLRQLLRTARHGRDVERGQLFDAETFQILRGSRRLGSGLSPHDGRLAQHGGREHGAITRCIDPLCQQNAITSIFRPATPRSAHRCARSCSPAAHRSSHRAESSALPDCTSDPETSLEGSAAPPTVRSPMRRQVLSGCRSRHHSLGAAPGLAPRHGGRPRARRGRDLDLAAPHLPIRPPVLLQVERDRREHVRQRRPDIAPPVGVEIHGVLQVARRHELGLAERPGPRSLETARARCRRGSGCRAR